MNRKNGGGGGKKQQLENTRKHTEGEERGGNRYTRMGLEISIRVVATENLLSLRSGISMYLALSRRPLRDNCWNCKEVSQGEVFVVICTEVSTRSHLPNTIMPSTYYIFIEYDSLKHLGICPHTDSLTPLSQGLFHTLKTITLSLICVKLTHELKKKA